MNQSERSLNNLKIRNIDKIIKNQIKEDTYNQTKRIFSEVADEKTSIIGSKLDMHANI